MNIKGFFKTLQPSDYGIPIAVNKSGGNKETK